MTPYRHPLGLSPQQHTLLIDAAKRHAAQLRREAISDAVAWALSALQRGLSSAARRLRRRAKQPSAAGLHAPGHSRSRALRPFAG
ncbi:MAG: hypothetical protein C0423_09040 [Methylibium sp.]|nr:hypothetical protein [Methylibium sp.]